MNFEYTSSSNSTKNGANNNAKTELMEDVIFSIMDEEKKKLNTTPISLKRL